MFDWKVPSYLPMREFGNPKNEYSWEDWEEERKKETPFKYFVFKTIPDKFWSSKRSVGEFFYKVESLTWNRQHLIDIRPKNGESDNYRYGYLDTCEKILYANMNLLSDFVENSGIHETMKYLAEDYGDGDRKALERLEAYEKALEIYEWWQNYSETYSNEKYYDQIKELNKEDEEKISYLRNQAY